MVEDRESRRFFVASIVVVLAWVVIQVGWMTAHVFGATRFILGDEGSYLYAVECSQAGEALYRDFAWQYGPLALGWYRAFAAFGGDTPLTLVVATSATFAAAWVVVARIVVGAAGWKTGGFLAVAGLLPIMSGSGVFALNGAHGAIEMLLLSLIAWSLSARGRAADSPWLLGFLVGLLQWVRFGPHIVAMAGILTLTAFQMWPKEATGRSFMRAMWAFAWRLVASYLLVAAPLMAWYFAALPLPGALEQLWPSYMKAHYAATYPNRWPQISSLDGFVTTWLPALLGVGVALGRLASLLRPGASASGSAKNCADAGLIFLPLQYALSCAVLFHDDHAMRGYLWLAWPGLALGARLTRWPVRALVLAAIMPSVLATANDYLSLIEEERASPARQMVLPNGQQLWFSPVEARRFAALQAALGPNPRSRKLAVFLAGGGIHHFFGTRRVGRHWWYLPEFVRPWEEAVVWDNLMHHDLILVADRDQVAASQSAPSKVVTLWMPLPREMALRLAPHLRNPVHLEGIGELMQVQP
jgi:hypothetical protein